ncbi:MAG: cob(I)yrinic acid a,c-diamide adenosyltransferase [Candidatus Promineifilaceae bacterium]|nr:cob(I)yrinic acid a,c-diamide adenosyltransferase [Candidatus Promineifilaceae bacterium]
MPRLTKIYTRQGDKGSTSLGTKQRVSKDDLRVQAYGEVDELNSTIGLAMASGLDESLLLSLKQIQNELFNLGADLAFPESGEDQIPVPRVNRGTALDLETLIDELMAVVGPLENFVLPGGCMGAAFLHVARTICRRAERTVVALDRSEEVNSEILVYLNRLSDALFVMARYENHVRGVEEPLWDTGG